MFQRIAQRIPREYLIFGLIGIVNTFIHFAVVLSLVESKILSPVFANVCGFLISNQCSFFLNCRLTFKARPNLVLFARFFVVSLATLIVTIVLATYAEWMGWHYVVGLLLVIVMGPPLAFVLQKHWVFCSVNTHADLHMTSEKFDRMILIIICSCCMVAISALALTVNGLAPIDDHQFIRTLFLGKDLGFYILPQIGRFFPLTAQEYVLASKIFDPSPFLFQLINCVKIVVTGVALLYCLFLTGASAILIAVLWGIVIFSIGFGNAAFRYHVGEINALILILFFIYTALLAEAKKDAGSQSRSLYIFFGILAMCLAFFYKEIIFILAIVFCALELFRNQRDFNKKRTFHLWFLLTAAVLYISIYWYWRASNVSQSYVAMHSGDFVENAELFFKNDIFIFVVTVPLTLYRGVVILINRERHTIFDSFLLASLFYTLAYLTLRIFNTYYLLPAYGFAVCGVAGVLKEMPFARYNHVVSGFIASFAINTAPTAISDMVYLKQISNNHLKFEFALSDWILLHPTPSAQRRNLVLVGVSNGSGAEIIRSLGTFLAAIGVPHSLFNVRHTLASDNDAISNAYSIEEEKPYSAKLDDIIILNPYMQAFEDFSLLTPSYLTIFRSPAEWSFPRRTLLDWLARCSQVRTECFSGAVSDRRYTGYAALLKIRDLSSTLSTPQVVQSPSYRIGETFIKQRMRAGQVLSRNIAVINSGDETWPANNTVNMPLAVNLAYVWIDSAGKVVLEGGRKSFFEPLLKNDIAKVSINIETPQARGKYKLIISPVQEGSKWFYSGSSEHNGKEIEIY